METEPTQCSGLYVSSLNITSGMPTRHMMANGSTSARVATRFDIISGMGDEIGNNA